MHSYLRFVSILFFVLNTLIIKAAVVTPEQFGAKGDGIEDDTYSIIKAFETRQTVELRNTYKVSKSLIVNSSISGGGRIIFAEEQISLHIRGKGISISSISFDYANHSGKMIRIQDATNVRFNNCMFENVGNDNSTSDVAFVFIMNNSNDIRFVECDFLHCKAKPSNYAASGIWINQESEETKSHHIYVDNCRFEDISPLSDADAIKVVGGNYDCFLYVKRCIFRTCEKRAMKFQGKKCFSQNNIIYVTKPMSYAIDFQRGHGKSENDKVILEYDVTSPVDKSMGLLYRAIGIAQGNVVVKNFSVKCIKGISNLHQVAFEFESLGGYDAGHVSNVKLTNCTIEGMGSILSCTSNLVGINKVKVKSLRFNSEIPCDAILFKHAQVSNSLFDIDISGQALYNLIYSTNNDQISDNDIRIKTESDKALKLPKSNKIRLTNTSK